ncbi:FHA domain-containing protein [Actinoplanes sp. NPDC051494]|uniref:FHA domain-containing protein n=1 Tax=Actinoplanes sp. NPDC051494 TaxID=3363907 RepID=UPI0037930832
MTTYTCPKGHDSSADDFCDTCGARISGAAPVAAPPATLAAPTGGVPCPHCGTPRVGAGRFCEDCGFDHQTGKIPVLTAPAPVTAPASWTASIAPDRGYFEANAIEGVDFPATAAARTVVVAPPQIRIGRASTSKGTAPEIDLRDDDPGVSHSHALLTLSVDGVWLLSDLGSTNGTYLNDEQKPLTAGQSRALNPGDRIHVGAWTTITLHTS